MKRPIYIILTLCLALSSCGMTDVWKDWENEGTMSEDRLRPSEVKALLCSGDGWKMTYEGTTFYFQFTTGGNVTSDSDETMFLQEPVETNYYLDFQGERAVLLTIVGNGMLQYLSENAESTWVITEYSATQITAHGQEYGLDVTLTPATSADLEQAQEAKRQARIAYYMERAVEELKTTYVKGLFRNASGELLGYYTLTCDDNEQWTATVTAMQNRTLSSAKEYSMTLSSDEEKTSLTFDESITLEGIRIDALQYGYDDGTLGTSAESVRIGSYTDKRNNYISGWVTHQLDWNYICAAFSSIPSVQIELDDRSPRNVVVCPGSSSDGQWHYVFFEISTQMDDTSDLIYLTNTKTDLPFGGYGNDVALVQGIYQPILDLCFSEGGVYMYEDTDGYVYVIDPVSGNWIRMR